MQNTALPPDWYRLELEHKSYKMELLNGTLHNKIRYKSGMLPGLATPNLGGGPSTLTMIKCWETGRSDLGAWSTSYTPTGRDQMFRAVQSRWNLITALHIWSTKMYETNAGKVEVAPSLLLDG